MQEAAPASGFGNQQGWSARAPKTGGERLPRLDECTDDFQYPGTQNRVVTPQGAPDGSLPEGRGESPGEAGSWLCACSGGTKRLKATPKRPHRQMKLKL